MAKVVLVDDELTIVQMVGEILRGDGHEVIPCTNLEGALAAVSSNQPELVVTDLYLDKSGAKGLEVVRKARNLSPQPAVIVMTGYGSIETAVEAMRYGAFDYLEKPFKVEEFRIAARRALSYSAAVSETTFLRRQLKKKYHFSQIIGCSEKMQGVFKMIERVADTESTVLILGESGTGKELVARALHHNSRRQQAPFVPINCSALPETLLESELFGHRRGSFTGAIADKKGLFQEADGGTIFLDEVGSMSPLLQSRLLRVLQEREIRRVGENMPIYVNVRVLAASNEPLEKKIQEGEFREDLYYRLNVIPIQLPSLRERLDDIPLLVAHFVRGRLHHRTRKAIQMTQHVLDILQAHQWPGNVRELENAVERAATLCETEVIHACDLPPSIVARTRDRVSSTEESLAALLPSLPDPATPVAAASASSMATVPGLPSSPDQIKPLKGFLREQEQSYLNRVIDVVGGDKEKAALLLGVSLATLYRKLTEEEKAA